MKIQLTVVGKGEDFFIIDYNEKKYKVKKEEWYSILKLLDNSLNEVN